MKNILIYSSLIITVLVASCGPKSDDKEAELAKLKEQQKEVNAKIAKLQTELKATKKDSSASQGAVVQTKEVASTPFSHYIEVQGRIDSDKNVTLSAKSSGTITRVYVSEGQSVKKGQVLAQLESEMAQKGIAEIQTGLDLANTVYEKQKRLWEQKIGTEIQYLQAKNNKESLERRKASMVEQMELTRIVAPFAGVVDEVKIREGEVAAPGVPAIRIINPSDFKVIAELAEAHITKIKQGNNVVVELMDLEKKVNAKVSTISRVINPVNRSFTVEVDLPQSIDKEVKANMIATISIEDYKNPSAVVVPINVVQNSTEDGKYVFVAENNKAVKRLVKVGGTYNNDVEVIEGLKAGDKLIVAGYQDLVDQQSVAYNQ